MKKSKMFLSAFLAATMFAMPVCAAELTQSSNQGETKVSYGLASTYTVTIPVDFAFTDSDMESIGEVSATNVLLENGKKLVVTMTSANYDDTNKYTLDYGTGDVSMIEYYIKTDSGSGTYDTDFVNGSTVLEVEAGVTEKSVNVQFTTSEENIEKAIKSGEHNDTLTFACSVQ